MFFFLATIPMLCLLRVFDHRYLDDVWALFSLFARKISVYDISFYRIPHPVLNFYSLLEAPKR